MPVQQEKPTLVHLGITLFLVFAIVNSFRLANEFRGSSSRLTEIRQKIQYAKEENLKLRTELKYVQTDEYLEKAAVEKLNMTKPGSKVLVINENTPEIILKKQSKEPVIVKKTNYELWMEAFKLSK
jgi:cell division protein FtsB